jgi:DNA end-binding protein Ku
MLELMHFPKELIDVSEFKEPSEKKIGKAEMQMAKQLIASMTTDWEPEKYNDEYHEALEKLIHDKIEHGDEAAPKPTPKRKPTNVIDLVSVLQESLQQKGKSTKGGKKAATKKAPRKTAHKKAA